MLNVKRFFQFYFPQKKDRGKKLKLPLSLGTVISSARVPRCARVRARVCVHLGERAHRPQKRVPSIDLSRAGLKRAKEWP